MSLTDRYKRLNSSRIIDWTIRLLFTINLFPVGIYIYPHYEPIIIVVLSIISVWFYFFNWKLASLIPQLYLTFFNVLFYIN